MKEKDNENKDGQLWYGSMIHHKSVSGEQTNMIKTRLWKRLKWILMDKDDKKKRWPTLTWMHLKSVCGQQTNKDNAEQVFEVRWGGWQTWSCQFVKRSCKRHFFLTFFTSWRWCCWMFMTRIRTRVTSYIFQKLYCAIFQNQKMLFSILRKEGYPTPPSAIPSKQIMISSHYIQIGIATLVPFSIINGADTCG